MAELPMDKIAELCRRYGVKRLELFGSATTDKFDADSDFDFFVEFDKARSSAWDAYFDLQDELERLLGRSVDLVERASVRNRTFLRATEHGRQVVYAG